MRKIRDILRLRHDGGLSIRQIKASTKVSVGAIQNLLTRSKTLGVGWPLDPELTLLTTETTAEANAQLVLAYLESRGILAPA